MQDQNSKLIRKIMLSYAVTFIIINLTDSLTMIADGMIVSQGLGAKGLAAIGLADPSFKIVHLFSGVLAVGLQSMCSSAMGSGDRDKANRTFTAGMFAAISASVVLTVSFFAGTGLICNMFGADRDPEVYPHLYDYLKGWFTGIPGYVLFFTLVPLVNLDGNKKLVTAATFVQSVVNILGDYLSVFVFDGGTYGVGLSTGIAFNISAVMLLLNFARKRTAFKLFNTLPDFSTLPRTLSIGLPKITEQGCRILAPLLINRTVLTVGGNLAMSAMSVKSSVFGFCVIIGNGVAETVGLMTQILYSEKDERSLLSMFKAGVGLMVTLDTLFSFLLFVFSGPETTCQELFRILVKKFTPGR